MSEPSLFDVDPLDLASLNPDQLDAVVHRGGPLLVVAGAGSGAPRGDRTAFKAQSEALAARFLAEGTGGIAAFVPTADVVGSAVAVVYPFDRWRTLSRPATFDQVPAATAPAPDTPVIVGDPPLC